MFVQSGTIRKFLGSREGPLSRVGAGMLWYNFGLGQWPERMPGVRFHDDHAPVAALSPSFPDIIYSHDHKLSNKEMY